MRKLIAVLVFLAGGFFAHGQDATANNGEMTVASSVVCGMCKKTIENGMAYKEGVKTVKVDVDKNEIYVKYNPEKTDEATIKKEIASLGYKADDVTPTKEAYDSLHECCKADLGKH